MSTTNDKRGKTHRVRKIITTPAGESTRTSASDKKKPLDQRVGGRHKKGSKKVFQNVISDKRDTRNGKTGLRNITVIVNNDHNGDYYSNGSHNPFVRKTDYDVYATKTNESLTKKLDRCTPTDQKSETTETYYIPSISHSGHNIIRDEQVWENGRMVERTFYKTTL